jgi:L-aminopeptidase/D-esterase-like protein
MRWPSAAGETTAVVQAFRPCRIEATVQATEEAIVNALTAAETMAGVDGHKVEAISHDALRHTLRKYNRLVR